MRGRKIYILQTPKYKKPPIKMPTMNALTDKDLMPFGKYSKPPDGPRTMEDVPSDYLLWLWEEGCNHFGVRKYIEENLNTLLQECPDFIPPDERE